MPHPEATSHPKTTSNRQPQKKVSSRWPPKNSLYKKASTDSQQHLEATSGLPLPGACHASLLLSVVAKPELVLAIGFLQGQHALWGVPLCVHQQVLQALHFCQPADGTILRKTKVVIHYNVWLLFKAGLCRCLGLCHNVVKQVKRECLCRDQHSHPVLIQHINERDKAICLGYIGCVELWHPRQGQRVIMLSERNVVCCGNRFATQVVKRKHTSLAC
mmetsp:Transcript_14100/g.37581  ORF Transcript_14100/g.37581 Transcript_14100/m.37581 type:complete len:217 (+) Transcript_14100:739-1389(+)